MEIGVSALSDYLGRLGDNPLLVTAVAERGAGTTGHSTTRGILYARSSDRPITGGRGSQSRHIGALREGTASTAQVTLMANPHRPAGVGMAHRAGSVTRNCRLQITGTAGSRETMQCNQCLLLTFALPWLAACPAGHHHRCVFPADRRGGNWRIDR